MMSRKQLYAGPTVLWTFSLFYYFKLQVDLKPTAQCKEIKIVWKYVWFNTLNQYQPQFSAKDNCI